MENSYREEVFLLLTKIEEADAILVGATAGMSAVKGTCRERAGN